MTTEDEYIFRKIIDENKDISGKVSDVVILCLKRAGYNLKLTKLDDILETSDFNKTEWKEQVFMNLSLGRKDSYIEDSLIEFKMKSFRFRVDKVFKAITSELKGE